jgi:hypothetical protein
MTKAQVLLALQPGASVAELAAVLAEEAAHVLERAPEGCRQASLVRLEDDPLRQSAHGSETGEGPSFDAALELGGDGVDPAGLAGALAGLGSRLEKWISPERSAAVVGTAHTIVPGSRPLRLLFALRRLPALSPSAFHDYWLHEHAELGRRVSGGQGYHQLHGDPAATASAVRAAGLGLGDFDGVAEIHFPDLGFLLGLMQRPESAEEALEDERRFIDHSRSAIGLYDVVRTPSPATV